MKTYDKNSENYDGIIIVESISVRRVGPIRKHEYSDANRLQAVIDYEIGIRLI